MKPARIFKKPKVANHLQKRLEDRRLRKRGEEADLLIKNAETNERVRRRLMNEVDTWLRMFEPPTKMIARNEGKLIIAEDNLLKAATTKVLEENPEYKEIYGRVKRLFKEPETFGPAYRLMSQYRPLINRAINKKFNALLDGIQKQK